MNNSRPSAKILPIPRDEVIAGVVEQVVWWIGNRRRKLKELRHESHAVNPFLLPIIMNMHGFENFQGLAEFMLAGHLVEGHATGFGKLVDEKILDIFGTTKLDRSFRRENAEYQRPEYDNIDHLIFHDDRPPDLLSVKAGRWSIQLGQAVQLNRSFQVLVDRRAAGEVQFRELVVGVFYGKEADLTDKYRIICGRSGTGARHDVRDLTDHVRVLAGRPFWSWLNGGIAETQDWILDGIVQGFDIAVRKFGPLRQHFKEFVDSFAGTFDQHIRPDGSVDWHALLRSING